ncbi:alpha/beta hydrolase [Aquipuribacter nitratireducens]|uniref:Alpha/beta hydrolase n=1 Tax=Aquipuribacter nitratireducens TaxID=650104 RepID=A0ABW0GIS8_9MICO
MGALARAREPGLRLRPVAAALRLVGDAVYGAPPAGVRRHSLRTAPGPASPDGVRLVVHSPAPGAVEVGTELPVVVHLHGGGWALGDVEPTPWWVAALTLAVPAVVVSVAYRLAPEHPFPAGLEDCVHAVRWTAAEPGRVGAGARLRTGSLCLVGDSAGGNLAAATAARLRDEPAPGDPVLAAQVLVYPALDATLTSPSVARNATAPFLTAQDLRRFVGLYLDGTGTDPADPRVSPLRDRDLRGLPPTHVLTAEHDPLRDEGLAYAARLRAAGVPVRATDHPGAVHGFLSTAGLGRQRARHALGEVAAFLREALAEG